MENWTKIKMSSGYGTKVTVELDHSDTNLDEMLDACVTCLVGLGFIRDGIIQSLKEYAEREYTEKENE